jgi:hypothetical protein
MKISSTSKVDDTLTEPLFDMHIESVVSAGIPFGLWAIFFATTPAQHRRRFTLHSLHAVAFCVTIFLVTETYFSTAPADLVRSLTFSLLLGALIAGAMPRASRLVTTICSIVGGVALFIAANWMQTGWLAMLGKFNRLGHGSVDLFGLAVVGLVAGGLAIAFAEINRNYAQISTPKLPSSDEKSLILLGGAVIVAGMSAVMLRAETAPQIQSQWTILFVACIVSGAVVLSYARFVSSRWNIAIAARAIIATLFAVSSGGALLPFWATILLSLSIAVSIIWIDFKIRQRYEDANGVIAGVYLPALFGMLATGLFANGSALVGWNGVGESSYLNVPRLGVVGALSPVHIGDLGQLTAQVVGIMAITTLSVIPTLLMLKLTSNFVLPTDAEMQTALAVSTMKDAIADSPIETESPTPVSLPEGMMATGSLFSRIKQTQTTPEPTPAKKYRTQKIAYPIRARIKRSSPKHIDSSSDADSMS